jgi:hypothetical protein
VTDRDTKQGKKGLLSDETTAVLEDWVANNFGNPYPSEDDKVHLVRLTGAHIRQVCPVNLCECVVNACANHWWKL